MLFVDADDYCETNDGNGLLEALHVRNPAFAVTLFTIPAHCSLPWLERKLQVPWMRLVPHGWRHGTSRECEAWSYDTSRRYLDAVEPLGMERGFKAPGWQISDGMYRALLDRGWWVADQHYNDARRPAGLRVFHPGAHHYHVGQWGEGKNANEIGRYLDELAGMKGETFGLLG